MKYKFVIIIILSICLLSGLLYFQIEQRIKYEKLNEECTSLIKDLEYREKFTGMYIWDLLGIKKDKYNIFAEENNLNNLYFFIIVDSIDCYSCFKFHEKNLKEFSDHSIAFYSPRYSKFVKSNFKSAIEYNNSQIDNIEKALLKKIIVVCLINKDGKLIYIDFADKSNYKKSIAFYHIIRGYLYNDRNK